MALGVRRPRSRLVRGSNIVRAILHLAGATRIADAARELQDGRVGSGTDFLWRSADHAEQALQRVSGEFVHAADGDLSAAEAALERVLAAAPERETLGRALRDAEALHAYLLNHNAREERAQLLSDDAQRYFDRLFKLTCSFIARTVQENDLSGRAERAGLSELLTGFDSLQQAVGNVLDVVTTNGPPSPPPDGQLARAREASELARQSTLPEILPDMDRLAGLQETVGRLDEISGSLVVTGEGGLGKSVLAGQLFGHLSSALEPPDVVVFVPCARIPASARLDSAEAIDLAFGNAVADDRESGPLSGILAEVRETARVMVILDTLDLILTDDDVDDVAYVLRRIGRGADLIVTCRDQEWHGYLGLQKDLMTQQYRMPPLRPDEIVQWARSYVDAQAISQSSRDAFVESLSERVAGTAVGEIFSSPLRLAMACEIYASAGRIPEGLTVTRLYDAYWDRRVARDRRGRRSARAREQVKAAEALAASIWALSTSRFVEFVPESEGMTATALNDLLSEGTVKVVGGRYAFFHQTYAEFAVARHLATHGTEADLARLESGLRSNTPAYWAIARHLLQVEASTARFEELSTFVPADSVEGVRIHVQGAFTQDDPRLVEQVTQVVKATHPDVLVAASSVLDLPPANCTAVALEAALWCLQHADRSMVTKVAVTTATLIRAVAGDSQTAALDQALSILLAHPDLDEVSGRAVIRRILQQTVAMGADGVDRRMLVRRYDDVPEPARAEIVAAVRREGSDDSLATALVVEALRSPCPSGAVEDMTSVLVRVWEHPAVRAAAGWSDWRSMLEIDLPDRWDACQVRLARHISADPGIARQVLATAFDSTTVVARDRYTNAVMFIADDQPYLVARAIVDAASADVSSAVIGTFAGAAIHSASKLDEATRADLGESLRKYLTAHPRKVWPAVIKLHSGDIGRLRDYLRELQRFAADEAAGLMHGQVAVRKAFDAIVNSANADVVRQLEPDLKLLCASSEPADLERIAQLRGLMTPISATARDWVSEQLLTGQRHKLASAAAQTVVDSLDDWTEPTWTTVGVPWLLGLLASRHPTAVLKLATAIAQRSEKLTFTADWATTVVDRVIASLAAGEDSQVQTALVRLLVRIDQSIGLQTTQTGQIVDAYIAAVRIALSSPRPDRSLPATFARLTEVILSLALKHYPAQDCGNVLYTVLTEFDSAALANVDQRTQDDVAGRARRNLASMLIGVVRKHPVLLSRVEEAWDRSSASNKAAIAECVATTEYGTAGIVSLKLARHPDCPTETANYIHDRFPG